MSGSPWPLPRRPSVAGADDALRRLAESDLIAVVTATADGAITDANGAFLELTGYSQADLRAGRISWRAMTPPEWEPADRAALAELHEAGSCVPFRKEYWRTDGSRVPVEVSAVLLSPEPLRWACFIRDASAEQQAQTAAEQAASLASLAAALSHAATTDEVAQALGVQLRRSAGANLATIIEADPDRPVVRFGPLIVLTGEADITNAAELSELITGQLAGGTLHLTVDVAGLDFADTAAIRVFILAAKTLRQRGGDLVLLRPQRTLARCSKSSA